MHGLIFDVHGSVFIPKEPQLSREFIITVPEENADLQPIHNFHGIGFVTAYNWVSAQCFAGFTEAAGSFVKGGSCMVGGNVIWRGQ